MKLSKSTQQQTQRRDTSAETIAMYSLFYVIEIGARASLACPLACGPGILLCLYSQSKYKLKRFLNFLLAKAVKEKRFYREGWH
jgi:hypothetical protein